MARKGFFHRFIQSEDFFICFKSSNSIIILLFTTLISANQINSWFETLKKFVKSKKKKKSWHDRSRAYQEDWDKMRLHLWKVMQAREVPNDLCAVCGDRQSDVRCLDCYQSYCYLCDDVYHLSNPFHDRLWSGRPLDVLECLNEKKEIVSTGIISFRSLSRFKVWCGSS